MQRLAVILGVACIIVFNHRNKLYTLAACKSASVATNAAVSSTSSILADAPDVPTDLLMLEKDFPLVVAAANSIHKQAAARQTRQLTFTWPYFGLFKRNYVGYNPNYCKCYYPRYNSGYFYSYFG